MKTKILALLLLGATSMFAGPRWSIGIGVGGFAPFGGFYAAAPPPAPFVAPAPAFASPGFTWIPGYYYPVGPRWVWRAGYWARPPYAGAVWVGPRYYGGRYFGGHWRRR
ncbi:MAG: YXWGXW repeat-containing protein [Bryobacterales bacterium]|nr:YXWGXW repeat-containing protein [Bryobacterales bacterium]MBV9401136.1 YXWGXW repeat-containing protein [Bryobacterales bacterium]